MCVYTLPRDSALYLVCTGVTYRYCSGRSIIT